MNTIKLYKGITLKSTQTCEGTHDQAVRWTHQILLRGKYSAAKVNGVTTVEVVKGAGRLIR